MEKNRTLIIWDKMGKASKFNHVKDFDENFDGEDFISFTYFGVSTKTKRMAKFYLRDIRGYAIEVF